MSTSNRKKVSVATAEAQPLDHVNEDESQGEEGGGEFYAQQYPVIKLIEEYMTQHPVNGKKMTIKAFAEIADIPHATLGSIMNGYRWIARSSRDLVEKLAACLEVPVLQIYSMSGFISPSDVVATQSLDKMLNAIHQTMLVDPGAYYRVPSVKAWSQWPIDARLCYCMMYEAYTNKRLMRYAAIHVK